MSLDFDEVFSLNVICWPSPAVAWFQWLTCALCSAWLPWGTVGHEITVRPAAASLLNHKAVDKLFQSDSCQEHCFSQFLAFSFSSLCPSVKTIPRVSEHLCSKNLFYLQRNHRPLLLPSQAGSMCPLSGVMKCQLLIERENEVRCIYFYSH